MTATLNASTSSGVIVTSDTSGNLDIQSNGTTKLSVTNTGVSTPAGTVAINGPAFSAYSSAGQTISVNTWTKVTIDVEDFDTNNNFASSRFTPTIAGYYQISGAVTMNTNGAIICSIYKNGAEFKRLGYTSNGVTIGSSYPIYFNGTTDYVELYVYSSLTVVNGTSPVTYFGGVMVRAA